MLFPKILTERLALRQLEESDTHRIFEYRSRPEVSRFQSWGTQAIEEIQSHVDRLAAIEPGIPGLWYQVGIDLRSSGELIGDCGFQVLETQPWQVECGIAVAPEYQSQGYASEALRALLDYVFIEVGKLRAFGSVDPRNSASIRLMRRVGMRREAHLAQSLWFKGEWVDEIIFAVLASDWRAGNREASRTASK
jgi:RimJ/RimL family protein N-acetyltransferase